MAPAEQRNIDRLNIEKTKPCYLCPITKITADVIKNSKEGLVYAMSLDNSICWLISNIQQTAILSAMLIILPRNNPAAPISNCKNTIVELK